ncbi:MAG TPA: NBR1-Ig-like domain-containing protein [Anaerolineae bacterium]|nr:NBR1-Ig-like domain-containing protein [Anaerolineae bacterium]
MSLTSRPLLIPAVILGVIVIGTVGLLLTRGATPPCGAYTVTASAPLALDNGLSISLAAGELRFDHARLAEADLTAAANAQMLAAVRALPVNLRLQGSLLSFTRCGEAATPIHLESPAPNPSLDAYAWDGARWAWLGGAADKLAIDLPDLPHAIAWVQSLPAAPTIGAEPDPETGGLDSQYNGVITELYAPGLSVAANGSVTGQAPAAPEPSAPYVVYPIVSNVKPDGEIDADALTAMLGDEVARQRHVDALAAIATGSNFAGIAIEYRDLPADRRDAFVGFLGELASALHAQDKQLAVSLQWPGPEPDSESGSYYARVGRPADIVLVETGFKATGYVPNDMVAGGLKWLTQRIDRNKVQPIMTAASLGSSGDGELPIAFEAALVSLVNNAPKVISATNGAALNFSLNPSATLTFDSALGSYDYATSAGETQSLYTAGTLAAKLNALSSLRLRGVVIRAVQGPDVAPNLAEPIKAYRQQRAISGSSELIVHWSITAEDGSTVLSESRPLTDPNLEWEADRDGVFTVSASIGSVKRDIAVVTVGEDTVVGGISATPTPTAGSCYNAGYVADVTVPDNTRFDKSKEFTKTWRVRNSGTCAWSADTEIAFVRGAQLGGTSPVKVGALEAGKTAEISVPMKASDKDGSYTGFWQLRNDDGAFGAELSVVIRVGAEAATPPPPVAPPAGGGRMEYGIHAHYYGYIDGEYGAQNILLYVNELGLGWVKIQFRWGDYDYYCGGPDLERLNTMISAANNAGLKVMLSVVTAPPCTHGWTSDVHAPPDDAAAYAEFVGGLSDLFRGRIHAIEVWNEQNISREWVSSPQTIDANRYTQLLIAAYNAIKAKDPNILVISGALAPTGWNDGVNAVDDFQYLRQMVAAGATKYMDCVGVHVNALRIPPSAGQGGEYDSLFNPPHHSWFFKDTVQGYQSITGKPACVTEFGVASQEGVGAVEGFEWSLDNTQQEQSDWVIEGMNLCRQWGCRLMILWNLDYGPATGLVNDNALYSFLDPRWGKRPIFPAVRNWCAANNCK